MYETVHSCLEGKGKIRPYLAAEAKLMLENLMPYDKIVSS